MLSRRYSALRLRLASSRIGSAHTMSVVYTYSWASFVALNLSYAPCSPIFVILPLMKLAGSYFE
jgi:hypothetical protein